MESTEVRPEAVEVAGDEDVRIKDDHAVQVCQDLVHYHLGQRLCPGFQNPEKPSQHSEFKQLIEDFRSWNARRARCMVHYTTQYTEMLR